MHVKVHFSFSKQINKNFKLRHLSYYFHFDFHSYVCVEYRFSVESKFWRDVYNTFWLILVQGKKIHFDIYCNFWSLTFFSLFNWSICIIKLAWGQWSLNPHSSYRTTLPPLWTLYVVDVTIMRICDVSNTGRISCTWIQGCPYITI